MIRHEAIDDDDLRRLIITGHIRYGGNMRLRVYGRLDCSSGKRMKRSSRVFFGDAAEARRHGRRAFAPVAIAFAMTMHAGKIRPPMRHLAIAGKMGHKDPRVVP